MIAADTNLLLRYFVKDNDAQTSVQWNDGSASARWMTRYSSA